MTKSRVLQQVQLFAEAVLSAAVCTILWRYIGDLSVFWSDGFDRHTMLCAAALALLVLPMLGALARFLRMLHAPTAQPQSVLFPLPLHHGLRPARP